MTNRFDILDTPLQGLKILQRKPIGDSRGFLERMFCSTDLRTLLDDKCVMQINHTLTSKRGTVRGMHLQRPPHTEKKIVSCLRGAIFDVAIDLRKNSRTLLQWHAEILTADSYKTMIIPEGFAHGFQTLADDTELIYFHTAAFQAESEQGFSASDPMLAIQWPEAITEQSTRDAAHAFLNREFEGISI